MVSRLPMPLFIHPPIIGRRKYAATPTAAMTTIVQITLLTVRGCITVKHCTSVFGGTDATGAAYCLRIHGQVIQAPAATRAHVAPTRD